MFEVEFQVRMRVVWRIVYEMSIFNQQLYRMELGMSLLIVCLFLTTKKQFMKNMTFCISHFPLHSRFVTDFGLKFKLFLVDLFFPRLFLTLIWHAIERNPIIPAKTHYVTIVSRFFFVTKTVIWLHLKWPPTCFWQKMCLRKKLKRRNFSKVRSKNNTFALSESGNHHSTLKWKSY